MKLQQYFKEHPKLAIAFSGGVDSVYLLYEAVKAGCDVHAYFVKSPFQPEFELEDAKRMIEQLKVPFTIKKVSVLEVEEVAQNPENRCYFCKKAVFQTIKEEAEKDGYMEIADGTNASDNYEDRPGMKALQQMGVLSPLRECGITKEEIRKRSKEAGLFTWNKPAYACLATRIPSQMRITEEMLAKVEQAEKALFDMGFTDFRVRVLRDGGAKLQMTEENWSLLLEKRNDVLKTLKKQFSVVTVDLELREPSC